MAKDKDKKDAEEKKKTKPKRGMGMFAVFLMIVASLAMIVFLQMTYVLFVVGMLPSFVAYYVDRSESRSLFHTVMPCNLSGVLPYVVELVASGNETSTMQTMMSDMTVILVMYVAAALGWILVYSSPFMARLFINALNERQIARVKSTQKRLVQEWGPEVTRGELDV